MGVNPTLGLTTEPVNALIGDCCSGLSEKVAPHAGFDDSSSYPLYGYLFEVTTSLVSDHDTEFMDPLWHHTQGYC
jgi:hypothetical protein